jgi:redox-sensitive bicupin YhaK (pirin superfamily)
LLASGKPFGITMTTKTIIRIDNAPPRHWVGDGFHVHSMFSYDRDAHLYSPFLMLDYGAPYLCEPRDVANGATPRGVGSHPHRGFETVTIAYSGEVAHRDSSGGGGIIGVGDVQWMTAGSGLVHDEFHSPAFSQAGGEMHMVQLWVNLPAKDKMTKPGYQAITNSDIAQAKLDKGSVRVIAGSLAGHGLQTNTPLKGAASTFTPMNVWDVRIKAGQTMSLPQPEGWTTLVLVQSGTVTVNDSKPAGAAQLVMLSRNGTDVSITASADTQLLLLAGEPINEPVVGYGPFVMNTEQEIRQAFIDFNAGKFGQIAK